MIDINKLGKPDWEELLVQVFRRIQNDGGILPPNAYWARLTTFPVVYHEVVTLAPSDDGSDWEVLLDLRPADDLFYANKFGTQGGTVMMRKGLKDLFRRHAKKESLIPFESLSEFRFCGLATTPWAKRDHAYVPVFARLLPRKPEKFQGTWVSVSKRDQYPIDISCSVYVDMAVRVMLEGAQPYYAEFPGTYSDLPVPSLDEGFPLVVDNDTNPIEVVTAAGCNFKGWKYIGPALSGEVTYRAKLIKLGRVPNLADAKLKAGEKGYRLLEGQAADTFSIQYPTYDGQGPVIFGGSEWEYPQGERRVAVLIPSGDAWVQDFQWSETSFGPEDRWAVVPLKQE